MKGWLNEVEEGQCSTTGRTFREKLNQARANVPFKSEGTCIGEKEKWKIETLETEGGNMKEGNMRGMGS